MFYVGKTYNGPFRNVYETFENRKYFSHSNLTKF